MHLRQNYRLYPTKKQAETLAKWLGQGRYIWNYMLDLNKTTYASSKKFVFEYDMNMMLPGLKKQPGLEFLKEIPSQSLQQKCKDLDQALKNTFKYGRGFPKFKSRKTDESGIRFPKPRLEGTKLILPKMEAIKMVLHRPIYGTISSATVSKDKTGAYFVSFW